MTLEEIRLEIVTIAFDALSKGSHYLWGTAGDIPDLIENGMPQEGIKGQIGNIITSNQTTELSHPCIMAAETSVGGKKYICGGSWKNFGNGTPVNFNNSEEKIQLESYLESLKGVAITDWQVQKGELSPRVDKGAVVWGQDCRGIQHFDCVGLVNYCVSQAIGKKVIYEIAQWASNISGTIKTDLSDPPANADLLFKHNIAPNFGHIGLLYCDEDGNAIVIQAADTDLGIIAGPYTVGGNDPWIERRTITSALLH